MTLTRLKGVVKEKNSISKQHQISLSAYTAILLKDINRIQTQDTLHEFTLLQATDNLSVNAFFANVIVRSESIDLLGIVQWQIYT